MSTGRQRAATLQPSRFHNLHQSRKVRHQSLYEVPVICEVKADRNKEAEALAEHSHGRVVVDQEVVEGAIVFKLGHVATQIFGVIAKQPFLVIIKCFIFGKYRIMYLVHLFH